MALCTITLETLVNYIDGTASPEEARRVEEHVRTGCTSCHQRLAELRQDIGALQAMLAVPTPVPSPAVREFARNLSRLRAPVPAPAALPRITRWLAQLITPQSLAPAGARFTGGQYSAQQLFESPEHIVTLWEEDSTGDDGSYVICQFYSRREGICLTPESVLFTAASTGIAREAHHEEGEFHLSHLPADNYLVQCWLGEFEELALHQVQIGRR